MSIDDYHQRLDENIDEYSVMDHVAVYHLPEYDKDTITLIYVEKNSKILSLDGGDIPRLLAPFYLTDIVVVSITEEEEESLRAKDGRVTLQNEFLNDTNNWIRLGSYKGCLILYDTEAI